MALFNNEEYLKSQIHKQYEQEICSTNKVKLEIKNVLSDEKMASLSFLDHSTILEIQAFVQKGELSYETLCQYYLTKIKQSHLNAILELNPVALEAARGRTYNGEPLTGIPVLIKGNIGTKNMHTTAGAAALRNFQCKEDAEIIKLLRSKGAIILGKTNLSEWANFMSTESSNGYSALGGQTKNPYGHFDVGGSSSGSAAAAAEGLAPLTIGTETAGSIIYPSSQNSVFGLKPTLGLVSQDRIIPISKSHDTAGPMTRHIEDLFLLFQGITTIEDIPVWDTGYLKGKKIGIVTNKAVVDYYRKEDQGFIDQLTEELETLGARVEEMLLKESAFDTKVYDILKYEFKIGIKSFLKEQSDYPVKDIEDIRLFNQSDLEKYAPFKQDILEQACDEAYDEEIIGKQRELNRQLTSEALDEAFEEFDFLVTLSNYCTSVYAPAGYPALCIPIGYRESNEPIGMTFIGKCGADIDLIDAAYAYDAQMKHRKNPEGGIYA